MKSTSITLAAALLLAAFGLIEVAYAQNTALIHHKIVKSHNEPPSMGRDFWFAAPSNEWGVKQAQTYLQIYITSSSNTTAYVESMGGAITKVTVTAYRVSTFNVPEFWEMESSGVPEDKAIHVWSNDADLSVYFMSNQPFSSDGSYIIPAIGWGTDYVVAAYESLFGNDGDGTYDLPSECVIVANQDNTTFTITPSCDVRQSTGGNINGDANSGIAVYPNGVPATFTINRGQTMQFMAVKATNDSTFDMTGTIVHANQPIGVLGASMAADISAGFFYANFVCEMMPPVRTWGETYYGTSYSQPPGEPSHDYARYLFISSQANQYIYSTNCLTGNHTECVINDKYGTAWAEEELGEKFYSNQPFLCVSYSNSETYPDDAEGLGDPTECILPSREQYTKTVIIQCPQSVGNIVPFTDYVNIITRVQDEENVTIDGKPILAIPSQCIDGIFDVRTIPNISPGVHVIQSDSTVGVYGYGYGFDESYAWSSPISCATFDSQDTIAPLVDTTGECLNAFVQVIDSGLLPDGVNMQSGLSMIRIDSVYNMDYTVNPNWIEGSGGPSSAYSMNVIDPTKPAILVVEVYDIAGNESTVTSYYDPQIVSIKPPLQNLGVWIVGPPNGSPENRLVADTLYNTGTIPFDISTLQLKYGNLGFSLWDSTGTGPADKSPLQPGQRRLIAIQFTAIKVSPVVDSIIFGDGCFAQSVAVIGSGGANDFLVTNQNWFNEPYPAIVGGYHKTVTIENLSRDTIHIISASWPNTHFTAVSTFPIVLPPSPGSVQFVIAYTPTVSSITTEDRTLGTWLSSDVLEPDGKTPSPRFDSLNGLSITSGETFVQSIDTTFECVPATDTATAAFTITATGTNNSVIDRVLHSDSTHFFNLLGTVNSNTLIWNPETQAQTLTPGQSATISIQYTVPAGQNVTFADTLTAIDGQGDTIGDSSLTITVNDNSIAGKCATCPDTAVTNPSTISFEPVDSLSQNPVLGTDSFEIQNKGECPLVIYYLILQPGGSYNAAFTFTTVPTCPDTIPAGGSMLVTVVYNDTASNAPAQTTYLEIVGDMSNELSETLIPMIGNSGVKEAIVPTLNAITLPAVDGRSMEVILPPTVADPVSFTLVNVLGQSVLRATFGAGTQNVDASSLPRGVYFYRLTSGQLSQSGKVILGEY
jgi:IgGFc binding protein